MYITGDQDKSAILINGFRTTIYITNCFFTSCQLVNGAIYLDTRSFEITHCCFTDIITHGQNTIFYGVISQTDDFGLFLYNSVVNSGSLNSPTGTGIIYCRDGDQHFRCNNLTNAFCVGFKHESPRCFSFSMNTLFNCYSYCFDFVGAQDNEYIINQVNFFCHKNDNTDERFLLHLNQGTSYSLTLKDSVILSNISKLIDSRYEISVSVFLENCLISSLFDQNKAEYVNCTIVSYDFDYIILLPHYTYENECLGKFDNKNISAKGCNADNCIDENCGFTFSFSFGLLPFTTIHHIDFQTATFTPNKFLSPTEFFSQSKYFTKTMKFSYSNQFSASNKFSKSIYFSESHQFTQSLQNTQKFSKSNTFTRSNSFTFSKIFTNSKSFSPTPTQSIYNNIKTYSLTLSQIMISIRTVTFSSSLTFSKSYYKCYDADLHESFCETFAYYQQMIPYVITSLSQSVVQSLMDHEMKFKKRMSAEVLTGIVCGVVSVFFAIIGFIYLFINRKYSTKSYESSISSSSMNDDEIIQADGIDNKTIENVNNNDDKWL